MAPASNNRSEDGASDEEGLTRCPECHRHFGSQRGLSIHRRTAHPKEYNLENVPKERKKARWDHEEMVLLPRREIDLLATGGRLNVNKCLAEAEIDLDGIRLEDIEPGVPSDWLREAIYSNYEAWLPAPAKAGQSQSAGGPCQEEDSICPSAAVSRQGSYTLCAAGHRGKLA